MEINAFKTAPMGPIMMVLNVVHVHQHAVNAREQLQPVLPVLLVNSSTMVNAMLPALLLSLQESAQTSAKMGSI